MKLFRRIAALVLTLAVIAMFGISASAASFQQHVDKGNGTGAYVYGTLLDEYASASIDVYGTENPGNYLKAEFDYVYWDNADWNCYWDTVAEESYSTDSCTASYAIESVYHFTETTCRYYASYGVYNGGPYTINYGPRGLTLP